MDTIKDSVQQKYGEAARQARSGAKAGCGCGDALLRADPITSNLYDEAQAAAIPAEALLASLGCGNPTALAELKPGEVVLDLGSGGGIDVLLSAKRVGPTGKAYGLDMTDEMLALARENQAKSGLDQRRVPEGRDRAHPAPRQLGRRHHLELRHQPVGRQGPRARGGVPRAEARRPVRRIGRRRQGRRRAGGTCAAAWSCGSAASPARSRKSSYREKLTQRRIRGDRRRTDPDLPRGRRPAVPRRSRTVGRGARSPRSTDAS